MNGAGDGAGGGNFGHTMPQVIGMRGDKRPACRQGRQARKRDACGYVATVAAAALLACAATAHALPMYDIATLGFTDLEHTRDDG